MRLECNHKTVSCPVWRRLLTFLLCSMVNTASAQPAAIPGCQGGGQNKPFCSAHHHGSWSREQPSRAKLHPRAVCKCTVRRGPDPRPLCPLASGVCVLHSDGRKGGRDARAKLMAVPCRSCARVLLLHHPPFLSYRIHLQLRIPA